MKKIFFIVYIELLNKNKWQWIQRCN